MPKQGHVAQSAIDPWAVQSRINTADARHALAAMLAPEPNAGMVDHRTGVMASGEIDSKIAGPTFRGLHVAVEPESMKVTVEAGHCIINTINEGPYFCALDQTKTLDLDPSDSAKPRIDMVIARVYDDGNSVIGSAPGQRKFAVEVWTGDAADNPPEWKPPLNGGYHILAVIHVAAKATKIDPKDVTDVRGPGLSTRGGIRVLPHQLADPTAAEFKAPGAFPGEQRWMMNEKTFPHQVYYGTTGPADRPHGWQGVTNALCYAAIQKCSNDWRRGKNPQVRVDVTWIDIPYPGLPYMLEASGRMQLYVSANVKLEAIITVDDNKDYINWHMQDTHNKGPDGPEGDSEMGFQVANMMVGPYTKGVRVHFGMKIWDDYGNSDRGWAPSPAPASHQLFAKVTPAAYGALRWDKNTT